MSRHGAVWTVPAALPFVDALVAGLFERFGRDPLTLAGIEILLPSRRACRSLAEAFLRAADRDVLLLPRLTALGDLDGDEIALALPAEPDATLDLPPAVAPLRRQLLLARLVRRWGRLRDGGDIPPGQALALAGDLALLVDRTHAERVSLDRLEALVPPELAGHWQQTVKFLDILRDAWPAVLAAEGTVDPADRRNRLIQGRIAAWAARPPQTPVVAAGFGTAIPAVAELIAAVAALPQGAVVLPGLDTGADDELWQAVCHDPSHPQHGMARLLDGLGVAREAVAAWQPGEGARTALAREVMRPASVSHRWRALASLPAGAFDGLTRLDLPGPHEEAATIALLLRERLEREGATAMLVTPDRNLARRVAAELRRWDIEIDDSGGVPLGRTAPGAFFRLLAEAALERLAPVPLLALLRHPLAACGAAPAAFRDTLRRFETAALRGPRPGPGLAGLRAVATAEFGAWLDALERALGPFLALVAAPEAGLEALLAAHVAAAEALAATDGAPGAARLWAQEAGEALADFVVELAGAAEGSERVAGADYPVLFEAALGGRVVRPRWGRHARLAILGTLEARLQSADLVVLGGLNEGTWPAAPADDPWMSRPMRQAFGLPPPEAEIGTAAHDFAAALEAPEVVLTRAVRVEGTPTVPSRWLLRLDTVRSALKLETLPPGPGTHRRFARMPALLDAPPAVRPVERPAPRPPVTARPRRLSVTEIETWRRDPYAIYARHVLKLDSLPPLDQDPGLADLGRLIHEALALFLRDAPTALPPDAAIRLEDAGSAAFREALARPGVWAFWWPRFRRIAAWFLTTEAARRPLLRLSLAETAGRLTLDVPAGAFVLTARADRIDVLGSGGLAIVDYKTGAVPAAEPVRLGLSPQLPLEAAIAEAGGFEGVPAAPVEALEFWRLSGGDPAGERKPLADPAALARAAREGLAALVLAFDDPATPYPAVPQPAWAPRWSDYDHLARVLEWGVGGEP